MALFGLLIFFSITRITLNHREWVSSQPAAISEYKLPKELVELIDHNPELPLKVIQAYLEQTTGLSQPRNIPKIMSLKLNIKRVIY